MHILVDMDGVIANWGKQWDHVLNTFWPDSWAPRSHQQTTFDLNAGLDAYDRDVVAMVMNHRHFYRDIEPMPGAVDALHRMVTDGHTVNICTSPWLTDETCVADKLAWLDTHVGAGWAERAVVTKDKTLVRGDILIDDKPEIRGAYEPIWEHILFDQPYNQGIDRQRITDWSIWDQQVFGVRAA